MVIVTGAESISGCDDQAVGSPVQSILSLPIDTYQNASASIGSAIIELSIGCTANFLRVAEPSLISIQGGSSAPWL